MNPEHKKAVDGFIENHSKQVKKELQLKAKITPQVFFFFEYTNSEKPFGWVPLPYAKEFFASSSYKQHLRKYIQDCYTAIEKQFKPRMKTFKAELIAVILISDMYVYNVILETSDNAKEFSKNAIPPSEHPLSREVIGFNIYFADDSMAYHYPYTRKGRNIFFEPDRIEGGRTFAGNFENLFPEKI